jgi:UDP-N-acetylmuramoylalanine--D-glutamate ligase
VQAKRNIFAHQTESDFAIYYPKNQFSSGNVQYSVGTKIPYTESPGAYIDQNNNLVVDSVTICNKSEFKLLGDHNVQNICAAVTAVWQVHQNIEAIRSVVTNFSGLEHRLELAGEIDGVKYYDDSFGTTPDTAIVAMDAFTQPKVMIVGGHDKGNPMAEMTKRLAQSDIAHIVFIGTTGSLLCDMAIASGLDPAKTTFRENGNSWTMQEIVDTAQAHAKSGDVVLLSTGSASFGIFKDYKDRGNQFKQTVQALHS